MFHLLIVAATYFEVKPLIDHCKTHKKNNITFHFLITGIGGVATSFALTQKLCIGNYDFVLNVGIAGTFTNRLPIGAVAMVTEDQFADLAFEEEKGYQTFFESGFIPNDSHPFKEGKLWPTEDLPKTFANSFNDLPKGRAITVNKVHGQQKTIDLVINKFAPEIESMEGAACFYVCNQLNVACAQVRSISNNVEVRNRDNWNIPNAISVLNQFLIGALLK